MAKSTNKFWWKTKLVVSTLRRKSIKAFLLRLWISWKSSSMSIKKQGYQPKQHSFTLTLMERSKLKTKKKISRTTLQWPTKSFRMPPQLLKGWDLCIWRRWKQLTYRWTALRRSPSEKSRSFIESKTSIKYLWSKRFHFWNTWICLCGGAKGEKLRPEFLTTSRWDSEQKSYLFQYFFLFINYSISRTWFRIMEIYNICYSK